MSDQLERIASALEQVVEMLREDREFLREAQEAMNVSPYDCDHPRSARVTDENRMPPRIGCGQCGAEDITKIRGAA